MRAVLLVAALLGLAACNPNRTVGQNVDHDANATGSALNRAADSTGRALNNAGTATRDTLDPPRGPAERAGRAVDRSTTGY